MLLQVVQRGLAHRGLADLGLSLDDIDQGVYIALLDCIQRIRHFRQILCDLIGLCIGNALVRRPERIQSAIQDFIPLGLQLRKHILKLLDLPLLRSCVRLLLLRLPLLEHLVIRCLCEVDLLLPLVNTLIIRIRDPLHGSVVGLLLALPSGLNRIGQKFVPLLIERLDLILIPFADFPQLCRVRLALSHLPGEFRVLHGLFLLGTEISNLLGVRIDHGLHNRIDILSLDRVLRLVYLVNGLDQKSLRRRPVVLGERLYKLAALRGVLADLLRHLYDLRIVAVLLRFFAEYGKCAHRRIDIFACPVRALQKVVHFSVKVLCQTGRSAFQRLFLADDVIGHVFLLQAVHALLRLGEQLFEGVRSGPGGLCLGFVAVLCRADGIVCRFKNRVVPVSVKQRSLRLVKSLLRDRRLSGVLLAPYVHQIGVDRIFLPVTLNPVLVLPDRALLCGFLCVIQESIRHIFQEMTVCGVDIGENLC